MNKNFKTILIAMNPIFSSLTHHIENTTFYAYNSIQLFKKKFLL